VREMCCDAVSPFTLSLFTRESTNEEVLSTARALLLVVGRCAEAEHTVVGLQPLPRPLSRGEGRAFS
jgi:hypothetical protein